MLQLINAGERAYVYITFNCLIVLVIPKWLPYNIKKYKNLGA